jgi:GDPmannose 4,6-dehydratase
MLRYSYAYLLLVYGVFDLGSRGNREGAGRGREFVTSTIVRQCVALKFGELDNYW